MKLPINITFILLLYCLFFKTSGILVESETLKTLFCSVNLSKNSSVNFRFQCLISITYNISDGPVSCTEFKYNSIIVQINSRFSNSSILCTSNFPIFPEAEFNKDYIQKTALDIRPKRTFTQVDDNSTYLYHLYTHPQIEPREGSCSAVKYTFLSVAYPAEKIFVLWYNLGTQRLHQDKSICWMGKLVKDSDRFNSKISATGASTNWGKLVPLGNIVVVPCIHPENKFLALHQNKRKLDVDGVTVKYDPFHGFILNTSNLDLSGAFSCKLTFNVTENRRIIFSQDFVIKEEDVLSFVFNYKNLHPAKFPVKPPFFQNLQQSDGGEIWIYDFYGADYVMTCSSKEFNVTVKQCEHGRGEECWSISNKRITYTTQEINGIIYYSVEYRSESLKHSIRSHSVDETFRIICLSVNQEDNLFYNLSCPLRYRRVNPNFYNYDDKVSKVNFNYEKEDNLFTCINTKTPWLLHVRQILCENIFICRELARNIKFKVTMADLELGKSCFTFIGSKIETFVQSYNKVNQSQIDCIALKPLNQGIVHCSSSSKIYFQHIYFHGLNGQLYFAYADHYPLDAILKVTSNFKGSIYSIPGKYAFQCEAHSFYFEDGLYWLFEYFNGTTKEITNGNIAHQDVQALERNPLISHEFEFDDVSIVSLSCVAPLLSMMDVNSYGKWKTVTVNISSAYAVGATIVNPHTSVTINVGDRNKTVKCKASGFPTPKISWTKNGEALDTSITIIDNTDEKILVFPYNKESYEGNYICLAENFKGNATSVFTVTTQSLSEALQNNRTKLSIILPIVAVIAVSGFIIIAYGIYKRGRASRKKEFDVILDLLNGSKKSSEEQNELSEETSYDPYRMPYNNSFELEEHSFQIDRQKLLGEGEFGAVFKGRIAKIENEVAFKTTHSTNSYIQIKSLVSELKMFIYIGKHENIVELLGAYTKDLRKGIIYVAFELCGLGSLLSYLQSNKGRFLQCPILRVNAVGEYSNLKITEQMLRNVSDKSSIKVLLKLSLDVASGMEHLASKKVVHSDLAARNVLLTVDFVAKITDFGLSRRTYYATEYLKKGQDPLPWRSLAVECFKTMTFSEKSDVWAYGILLWEIFTLGEIPYPGLSPGIEFTSKLEKGLRNVKPKYSSANIYEVMIECWHFDPILRPTFSLLKSCFHNALISNKYDVDPQIIKTDMSTLDSEYTVLEEVEIEVELSGIQYITPNLEH